MGSRGAYDKSSRFSFYFEPEYHAFAEVYGIKVLKFNGGANAKLPEYAKTSEAYLSVNLQGEMQHLRIYKDHRPIIEIDIGHSHHYNGGEGFVHVHDYSTDSNGHPVRHNGRPITAAESAKYGKIIEAMKQSLKGTAK